MTWPEAIRDGLCAIAAAFAIWAFCKYVLS
jgi:hypothetical protein